MTELKKDTPQKTGIDKDRAAVAEVLKRMFETPVADGRYNVGVCREELVLLIQSARLRALGYIHGAHSKMLDDGDDPRKLDVSELIAQAMEDLTLSGIVAWDGEDV